MNGLRRFAEGFAKLLLAVFCIALLGLAPIFAVAGHVDIAGTFAGLFLLGIATLSLPRLQSFEAFAVKLQLREELLKAQTTLDQLKALARSSARQGFLQARSLPMSKRREMVAMANDTIVAAALTDAEAAELQWPLMDAIARDLYSLGQLAAVHLKKVKAIYAVEAELKLVPARIVGAPDPNEPRRAKLEREKGRLMALEIPGHHGLITPESLGSALDGCLARFEQSPEDDQRLRGVLTSVRHIMADCLQAESITPDFEAIVKFLPVHAPGFLARNDLEERAEALLDGRFRRG